MPCRFGFSGTLAVAALFFLAGTQAGPAFAASIHEQDLRRFGPTAARTSTPRPAPPALESKSMPPLVKMVYGYYPYWMSGYESLDYSLLSHIAWFAIE
jgi:hypothetical protein